MMDAILNGAEFAVLGVHFKLVNGKLFRASVTVDTDNPAQSAQFIWVLDETYTLAAFLKALWETKTLMETAHEKESHDTSGKRG